MLLILWSARTHLQECVRPFVPVGSETLQSVWIHVGVWVKTAYGHCPPSCWEENSVALCEPQLDPWPLRITQWKQEAHRNTDSDTYTHARRYMSTLSQPAVPWLNAPHRGRAVRRWEWQASRPAGLFSQAVKEPLWNLTLFKPTCHPAGKPTQSSRTTFPALNKCRLQWCHQFVGELFVFTVVHVVTYTAGLCCDTVLTLGCFTCVLSREKTLFLHSCTCFQSMCNLFSQKLQIKTNQHVFAKSNLA